MDYLASLSKFLYSIQGSFLLIVGLGFIGFGIYFMIHPPQTDPDKDYTGISMFSMGAVMVVITLLIGKKLFSDNTFAKNFLSLEIFSSLFKLKV